MKETVAMLDALADRLEDSGMVGEAEGVDRVANTLEAAQPYMPSMVYPKGHPSNVMHLPKVTEAPTTDDVIMEHRDMAQPQIDTIKAALKQFEGVLDSLAAREPRLKASVQKYKQNVGQMASNIEWKLKDFLVFLMTELGGKETSTHHSMDHIRLAGSDRG
jgi:hypothetical protein